MKPQVLIVMGSDSDLPVMEGAEEILKKLGIPYEITIASAHRTPERAAKLASEAEEKGIEVIIAGAGMAAHLAGVLAAHTIVPVIGVPIDSSPLNGLDSLLSTVQMPPGVPVADNGNRQGRCKKCCNPFGPDYRQERSEGCKKTERLQEENG